jgi:hypothetical protein
MRFVARERDRPFEARRTRDGNAAPGRPAAIQASYGGARRWPAASTGASTRSRRVAETPWQSKTVRGVACGAPGRQRQRSVKPNVPGGKAAPLGYARQMP